MQQRNTSSASTRGVMPFILGALVIAVGALVWYLVASDGNTFWRSSPPASSSINIDVDSGPAAPAPVPADPAPAVPADPAAPAPTAD